MFIIAHSGVYKKFIMCFIMVYKSWKYWHNFVQLNKIIEILRCNYYFYFVYLCMLSLIRVKYLFHVLFSTRVSTQKKKNANNIYLIIIVNKIKGQRIKWHLHVFLFSQKGRGFKLNACLLLKMQKNSLQLQLVMLQTVFQQE